MKEIHMDLYQKEDSYWWSVLKRREALSAFNKFHRQDTSYKILDVGCGGAALLFDLKDKAKVFGVDFSFAACEYSKKKINNILQADALALPFKDNYFDVIFALDLIEHAQDDLGTLREIYRVCSCGGTCIISVPAWNCLWSGRDDWLGHRRRYTVESLKDVIEGAGFKIAECSYLYISLFIALYFINKTKQFFRRNKVKTDIISVPKLINSLLINLFIAEKRLSSWVKPPLGTSIICVVKKCP